MILSKHARKKKSSHMPYDLSLFSHNFMGVYSNFFDRSRYQILGISNNIAWTSRENAMNIPIKLTRLLWKSHGEIHHRSWISIPTKPIPWRCSLWRVAGVVGYSCRFIMINKIYLYIHYIYIHMYNIYNIIYIYTYIYIYIHIYTHI